MSDIASDNLETTDVSKVDDAVRATANGDIARAKQLLKSVVQNAPTEYVYQTETELGALAIRFWDRNEFMHYVTWREPERTIIWIRSAYPRAFYYLGFIAVKEGQYRTAIDYLDRGAALEPTNPKFVLEKAHALLKLGQHSAALELYEQVSAVGPFVSGHDVAVALRGKGFVLIEKGRLAEAEEAFKASLKLEPDSEVAQNELGYIAHLRGDGESAPLDVVPTSAGDLETCVTCGTKINSGTGLNVNGIAVVICEQCRKKMTKK